MPPEDGVLVEAGFVSGCEGHLFRVRFLPVGAKPRGAALFVPPFGEELNKSRHVVALAARHLAAAGVAVEVLDLLGCGDSEGSLEDARVDVWLTDFASRIASLGAQFSGPVHLWGLRAGALLASTLCSGAAARDFTGRLMLWQPVIHGRRVVTEFLRLRAAASLMAGTVKRETADTLRDRLLGGETLEVAGYRLTPQLAAGLDALSLNEMNPGGRPVHWVDVSRDPQAPLAPAARTLLDNWQHQGATVRVARVEGPVFWSAGELEDCAALGPVSVEALTGLAS